MSAVNEGSSSGSEGFPLVAVFLSDVEISSQLEGLLRSKYSSLLLVTEKAKLADLPTPILVVVDSIKEAAELRALPAADGIKILVVSGQGESENISAAFEAGADEVLFHPFVAEDVVEKIDKHLASFGA